MRKLNNGWERKYSISPNLNLVSLKSHDEMWTYKGADSYRSCLVSYIKTLKFGDMRHMFLKKIDTDSLLSGVLEGAEMTFSDKADILMTIGTWKKCALEVFPTEENLIDAADLYHMWEIQDKRLLPFQLNPIFDTPEKFEEVSSKGVFGEYAMRAYNEDKGKLAYLYLRQKNGKELKWRQKQALKNEIIGEDLTAVEVIFDEAKGLTYTCLICLPMNYELDFGLHCPNQ